jgi:DNA-binding LacI/PurR family transcriptional regulator
MSTQRKELSVDSVGSVSVRSSSASVISDVAREAGVSVSTVSRVLTGVVPVSEEKHHRVVEAIKTLGYRPNGAARALALGRLSLVAVVASDTTRFGYATTIQGIEEAARQAGLTVIIAVIDSATSDAVQRIRDLCLEHPVAGLIVLNYDAVGRAALNGAPKGLPVIAVSSDTTKNSLIPRVIFDDRTGGRTATEYLISLGHRTVHHISTPYDGQPSGRTKGWRSALRNAGLTVPPVIESGWTPRDGYRAGLRLLEMPDVTAVLCGNDEIAIGAMSALLGAGRRIPKDISVIGFDGHPMAEMWTPALTTVVQDFVALGRMAFQSMESLLSTGMPMSMVSELPHLVVRASTGAPPPR